MDGNDDDDEDVKPKAVLSGRFGLNPDEDLDDDNDVAASVVEPPAAPAAPAVPAGLSAAVRIASADSLASLCSCCDCVGCAPVIAGARCYADVCLFHCACTRLGGRMCKQAMAAIAAASMSNWDAGNDDDGDDDDEEEDGAREKKSSRRKSSKSSKKKSSKRKE